MPLPNDIGRCQGSKDLRHNVIAICDRRETCARYVERHTGSERTPNFAYLCIEGDDSYIPAEEPNDN